MADAFKFPDEIEASSDGKSTGPEVEIEIVDDTPLEDRNRTPLPREVVDELDKDDLEEYSDKVKKRLSQMKKVWHDERRAKEQATREREEALRFAQVREEENRHLKQRLGVGEKMYVEEITRTAATEVSVAKEKLRQAYESGDSELITNAQEALTDTKLKLREYQNYRPTLQPAENAVQMPQQARPAAPTPDPKAESWRQRNTWFGQDEEMTALALGLHEKLVKSGVDPQSDDYYQQVDKTIRKRFPEQFDEVPTQSRKTTTVVAPATRSTAPRKVQLTPTALALAKKYGISPEAYAKEVLKLENNNG